MVSLYVFVFECGTMACMNRVRLNSWNQVTPYNKGYLYSCVDSMLLFCNWLTMLVCLCLLSVCACCVFTSKYMCAVICLWFKGCEVNYL